MTVFSINKYIVQQQRAKNKGLTLRVNPYSINFVVLEDFLMGGTGFEPVTPAV